MDARLRDLERSWLESETVEDLLSYSQERIRTGQLPQAAGPLLDRLRAETLSLPDLRLAAHLEHPLACRLLDSPAPPALGDWVAGLQRWGFETVRDALLAGSASLRTTDLNPRGEHDHGAHERARLDCREECLELNSRLKGWLADPQRAPREDVVRHADVLLSYSCGCTCTNLVPVFRASAHAAYYALDESESVLPDWVACVEQAEPDLAALRSAALQAVAPLCRNPREGEGTPDPSSQDVLERLRQGFSGERLALAVYLGHPEARLATGEEVAHEPTNLYDWFIELEHWGRPVRMRALVGALQLVVQVYEARTAGDPHLAQTLRAVDFAVTQPSLVHMGDARRFCDQARAAGRRFDLDNPPELRSKLIFGNATRVGVACWLVARLGDLVDQSLYRIPDRLDELEVSMVCDLVESLTRELEYSTDAILEAVREFLIPPLFDGSLELGERRRT